jgi:hypothetical protein
MSNISQALLIMAKQPIAGQTKTRLRPALSDEAAMALYASFLQDIVELARRLAGVDPIIAYTPQSARPYFQTLAPAMRMIPQRGASLGERLAEALGATLATGYTHVAAINSDSPTLPLAYLEQAFSMLADEAVDVVLGPCEDGGYYLIGWKRPHPRLVTDVKMSTPRVLQDTIDIANAQRLRIHLLPAWYDVDTPADLVRLRRELASSEGGPAHTRAYLAGLI